MNKLLLFSALLLSACQSDTSKKASPTISQSVSPPPPTEMPEPPFVQEGVLEFLNPQADNKALLRLNIEIAHEVQERNQGLMWRKKMAENEAMLFVFDFPEIQSFWMRNTYISLDLIYINEKFEVVSVVKEVPILNDDPRPSIFPAMYVVEVNAGVAEKYGIKPGTQVAWSDFVTGMTLGKAEVRAF